MASVNKESLREEFDRLKADFQQLLCAKQMTAESQALVRGLLMLLEMVIAVFMERSTKKDSRNSSKPSSQTGKDETSSIQQGSNGKGKHENGETSSMTRTRETIQLVKVNRCAGCGADLRDEPAPQCERRTRIDIVFEKVVSHVDAEIKTCPDCQQQSKAAFPRDMPGPLQYGDGIKAYVLDLLMAQMISLDRVQKAIKTLLGVVISPATILKFVTRLAAALERWEALAIEELLYLPVINADETSLRVNKKNHWIHVYSSGDITIKRLHARRGCAAIEDIGIIPRYGGVVVHDCWASYLSYDHCHHGLCGSHLLRELQFIIDSNAYAWATNMKRLLQKTCARVTKKKHKRLTKREYQGLQKHYRNILTRGGKELPAVPVRQKGKRGRIAKSDAHNLCERLHKYEAAVLLFAKKSEVPFTNNRAERDLRMSKVKQKVSGCFRTERYAQAYCRISSYLQTMNNRGYNPLIAIQMALSGKIYAEWGE